MQYSRLTRRQLVTSAAYLVGAFSSAALLEACSSPAPAAAPTAVPQPTTPPKPAAAAPTPAPAPTAAAATKPAAAAATSAPAITGVTPAAEAAGIVVPKAARGELAEQTIVVAISGGPEADAHTRLASRFTEYTK